MRSGAKFCAECGTPTGAAGPAAARRDPSGARKIVTIVFADLVGSTALHERLDPESARRFMESYYAATRAAVESHGGVVTQLLGDGVKAVFGVPKVTEDDAIRAVRAGLAMQHAFRALAERQRGAVGVTGLRVAVNTGEVVAIDEKEIIGDPVNVAARLQERGKDGDVVIGESTHRLVDSQVTLELLGSFALKGRAEAVKAYRVVSLDRPSGAATAAFVGREEELGRITAVYETAVSTGAARLAVLLGSPGLGKSRLIGEFARRRGESAMVIDAHCDAAGGATFAPIADALRESLGIETGASSEEIRSVLDEAISDRAEGDRVATGITALLAGSPAAPEETFFVVRRLLAALAATRPVVLVIDDLQWAEPLLLDLVEHLIQWGRGVPLLVLIGARPELRDVRSALATPGPLVSDVLTLGGLDAGAAMRLAANAIGASDLPAAVAGKVLATSEGNPLFVGELVRMLVHEGALTREGDRWTIGTALETLEMPPTIHALLAARIERLGQEERAVLERAAVVGRHFSRGALAALSTGAAANLDTQLESLRRAELIERDTGWLFGEPALRFHHVLIRDAAYRRLLKGTRAELHERLADWIEERWGDVADHDETLGRHLEQAHHLLGELGPIDEHGRQLGARAAARLAAAGRRALESDDLPLAAGLLGRALDRLPADDPLRADLALDWTEALLSAGSVGAAAAAIDELGRFTAGSERLQAWHTCFTGQLTVLTAPETLRETTHRVAAATRSLAALGDAAGEAKGHYVQALALARLGKVGACETALDQALSASRRAGDRRRANTVLALAPLAALWGPSPVTRASGRCLDVVRVLRITQGAPAVEAVALSCQGVLEALRGRTDAAQHMLTAAREMVEELGITQRILAVDVLRGQVALLEGDAAAAERILREAYDGLRELGLGIDAARAAALLARAMLAQGRIADAESLSRESEALAGDDLKSAIAWRGVRAEALARNNQPAEAVALARRAVEIAAATDALLDHADARRALAIALRAAGSREEAEDEERRARELWEAKGSALLAGSPSDQPDRPASPRARRVRTNLANAVREKAVEAIARRDSDALRALYSDDYEIIDHAAGRVYGADEHVRGMDLLLRAKEPTHRQELLATLGPSLVLLREHNSASGATSPRYDVGSYEHQTIRLSEINEAARACRSESFAAHHLGDAIVRLYERYAELSPEGSERDRAITAARSFRAVAGTVLVEEMGKVATEVFAPDAECIDHRTLGTWSGRGPDTFVRHLRALTELATDVVLRDDDVIALEPTAVLTRRVSTGTWRDGGGDWERSFLSIFAFATDGRIAHIENFDAESHAEALARFDELTGTRGSHREESKPTTAPGLARVRRRVRSNLANATREKLMEAIQERDLGAARALYADDYEVLDHAAGTVYGADQVIRTIEFLYRADQPTYEQELVATLGSSLTLVRERTRASGASSRRYDVGDYEHETIRLTEVDEAGRFWRSESFAVGRLGEATVRMYQRYAELAPDGPERDRATMMTRAFRAVEDSDFEALSSLYAPGFEAIDRRVLATWGTRGSVSMAQHIDALQEVAENVVFHDEDVLALEPNGKLVRRTHSGTERKGGGAYERVFLFMMFGGADGRPTHAEFFDVDQEAEALARFAELSAPTVASEHFANDAWRAWKNWGEAWVRRDAASHASAHAVSLRYRDHRRLFRLDLDREGFLDYSRPMLETALRESSELLATRGERLAVVRFTVEFGEDENAPSAIDSLALIEVDEAGLVTAYDRYDREDLDQAHEELDARVTGDAERTFVRMSRRTLEIMRNGDWDVIHEVMAPGFKVHDHRRLGWHSELSDVGRWIESQKALLALAPDAIYRFEHARTCGPVTLYQVTRTGTHGGGEFADRFIAVSILDSAGRTLRMDLYDLDQYGAARAHFEQLSRSTDRAERLLGDRGVVA